MRPGKFLLLFLALLLAGCVAYLSPMAPVLSKWGSLPRLPQQPINYLIAGVAPEYSGYHQQAPEDFKGLTDTILIAQLEPRGRTIKLLSVPRDTRVNVAGYGWGKVNGANKHLGPQSLVNTLEDLTGLKLEGYVLLSLKALRDVTDALGGVELTVPKAMKYQDTAAKLNIDLKAGRQTLNGEQLEGFTRFRQDNLGDIGRVQRQQIMFQAVSARLKSPQGLLRAPQAAAALERNLRTDFDRDDAAHFLGMLLGGATLETFTLPGDFASIGGRSYWEPDRAGIAALVQQKF